MVRESRIHVRRNLLVCSDSECADENTSTVKVPSPAVKVADITTEPPKPSKLYCIDTTTFLVCTFWSYPLHRVAILLHHSYPSQLENTLFRIPRHRLEKNTESPFAGMFSIPLGGVDAEGASATRPIKLPSDIKVADLANFLEILYPE